MWPCVLERAHPLRAGSRDPTWMSGEVTSMPSLTRSGRPSFSFASSPPAGSRSTWFRVRRAIVGSQAVILRASRAGDVLRPRARRPSGSPSGAARRRAPRAAARAPAGRRPRRRRRAPRAAGGPASTAPAPSASAVATSVPRRMPPSSSTSSRSPTASTTAGSASIVGITPSSWRPPWFETTTPAAPCSAARTASVGLEHALDDDGNRDGGGKAFEVGPVERRVEDLHSLSRPPRARARTATDGHASRPGTSSGCGARDRARRRPGGRR